MGSCQGDESKSSGLIYKMQGGWFGSLTARLYRKLGADITTCMPFPDALHGEERFVT